MNFKLGELFCGPGGMALGAKMATPQSSLKGEDFSIGHVWGVDKDRNAIDTYNANGLGEGVQCDALDFSSNLKASEHKVIDDFPAINALAFGFPCNDFSMVGKRKGTTGSYGLLYKAGIAAIIQSSPKWFVAENVSGIHSANAGEAFKQILSELAEAGAGYELSVNMYKFEDYGVPQYRHRYIIVGIRKDQKFKFCVPAPEFKESHVHVRDALIRPFDHEPPYNSEKTRQDARVVERLLFTPPWRNAWYLEELLDMSSEDRRTALKEAPWYKSKLENLTDTEIKSRIEACRLHCTRAKMSHIYRRLHPDFPSYTITGSGGGGTHVYHWKECRALTNRERARLQSFPDWFEFKGPKEQVRKQIGMAVPPQGAKIIFEAILKTFAGIEYDWVEPSYTFEKTS